MRCRLYPFAGLLAGAVAALPAAPARAAPALVVVEHVLEHPPAQVALVTWEGRPAVMALSEPFGDAAAGRLPRRLLTLLRLREGALVVTQRWEVPVELRWAEPLRRRNGGWGWLALIGSEWELGLPRPEGLEWRLACRCPTAFAVGKAPLRLESPLARDLDGDGVPEVLLPDWRGLVVYRLSPGDALEPLWRDGWTVSERIVEDEGRLETRFTFPRFVLEDANGDGVRDLIQIGKQALKVTLHPPGARPPPGEPYALDEDTRGRLSGLNLREPLLLALQELGDAAFPSREALHGALAAVGATPAEEEAVAAAAREAMSVLFPQETPLPPPEGEGEESRDVLAVQDMNGDGTPDALILDSTERGDPFNQKNHVRWQPGRFAGGRLTFADTPKVFYTEGLAFARLVQAPREGESSLFLATMEVDLMAIVRAFMMHRVDFEVYLRPWRGGALVDPAPLRGTLNFRVDLGERDTRPMVLAADLDGDGRRELLFNLHPDSLTAFAAGPKAPALGDSPLATVEVPLPRGPDDILIGDLNGDGREALLLQYHGKAYPPEVQRTLRLVRLVERRAK